MTVSCAPYSYCLSNVIKLIFKSVLNSRTSRLTVQWNGGLCVGSTVFLVFSSNVLWKQVPADPWDDGWKSVVYLSCLPLECQAAAKGD